MRHVKTTTPAGTVVEVKSTTKTFNGLPVVSIEAVNQHGTKISKLLISNNVAWAMASALLMFLPEDGAECTTELISEG